VKIINLTQHPATPAQIAAGVVEPSDKKAVQQLLTFNELPARADIESRAARLAALAAEHGAHNAMIGGAPYLMGALERALAKEGVMPVFAFSKRESVETTGPDGTVTKTNVFKHVGFVA